MRFHIFVIAIGFAWCYGIDETVRFANPVVRSGARSMINEATWNDLENMISNFDKYLETMTQDNLGEQNLESLYHEMNEFI